MQVRVEGSRNFSWPSSQLSQLASGRGAHARCNSLFSFFVRLVERDLNYRAFVAHFVVRGLLFSAVLEVAQPRCTLFFENRLCCCSAMRTLRIAISTYRLFMISTQYVVDNCSNWLEESLKRQGLRQITFLVGQVMTTISMSCLLHQRRFYQKIKGLEIVGMCICIFVQ